MIPLKSETILKNCESTMVEYIISMSLENVL